ncbi:aminoacyl-tRNA hydrolase [Stenoxybacter acetivorans]|uniref:aminoacyl-tRNA hydrolase n=1 Tax=Stenoxybacter acetivorans TaxID=422441 RepID=UPI0005699C32|nr:aminoacyl-tRNA hydrolase [Stenoxybacter acetivorans]
MTPAIQLIVGLGNPGAEYADTRHNVGFWFIDAIAQSHKAVWREEKKFFGDVSRTRINGSDIYLLKPNTYMNHSGRAVQALSSFYKIPPHAILAVHDELDIPCGRIRFKKGGGNGGHNGLKDIQAQLGTPDFCRLRFGIDHPGEKHLVVNYVLNAPRQEERERINKAIITAQETLPLLITGDFAAAQQQLHSDKNE